MTRPYEMGGWSIKDLEVFNGTLRVKNLWSALTSRGLWNHVLVEKYMHKISLYEWLRMGSYSVCFSSIIWNGFLHILGWISK